MGLSTLTQRCKTPALRVGQYLSSKSSYFVDYIIICVQQQTAQPCEQGLQSYESSQKWAEAHTSFAT